MSAIIQKPYFDSGLIVDNNQPQYNEATVEKLAAIEMHISKTLGEAIVSNYPGREWHIAVDVEGELIIIKCPSLSTRKGYHLLFKNRNLKQLTRIAVTKAGEILERYAVTRKHKPIDGEIQSLIEDIHGDKLAPDKDTNETTASGGSKVWR